jgi:hypothetical protein
MWYGDRKLDYGELENLADEEVHKFVLRGIHCRYSSDHLEIAVLLPHDKDINDGLLISENVGSRSANPWGLFDMHGNVAEWTLSDYRSYPYDAHDGRNAGDLNVKKVSRGGSWRQRAKLAGAGVRTPYETWQKVYNVGFRVICDQ